MSSLSAASRGDGGRSDQGLGIAVTHDSSRLAWQTGRAATIWDLDRGKLLIALPDEPTSVWNLAWSPRGDRLALGLSDGGIVLWDLREIRAQLAALGLDW